MQDWAFLPLALPVQRSICAMLNESVESWERGDRPSHSVNANSRSFTNDSDYENDGGYYPEDHGGSAEPIDEPIDIFP